MAPAHLSPEGQPQVARRLPGIGPATPFDKMLLAISISSAPSTSFRPRTCWPPSLIRSILLASCLRVRIDIDRDLTLAAFPSEGSLLTIVPAHPVVARPCTADRSGRGADVGVRSSSAWQRAILRVVGLRSAVGQFVIGITGLLQSWGRLTIEWGRLLGLRMTKLISSVERGVGWSLRLPIQGARAAVLALRPATRAAFHHGLPWLREARVSAAQFAAPTVIIASLLAAVVFARTQWLVPDGMTPLTLASAGAAPRVLPPIESRSIAFESLPPTPAPGSSIQQHSPATTERGVDAKPIQSQRTSPVTSTAAIQRLLNRYRDAYSTLDVSAVRAIWPSVDTNALRMAFDRLAEHNLDYHGCRISVSDARAEAVCRGIAQSLRVGARTSLTQNRQWQFVLNRVGDRWLIASVDPR